MEVLVTRERKYKTWIMKETIYNEIDIYENIKLYLNKSITRAAKFSALVKHTANKEGRQHIRADKIQNWQDLAKKAEAAAAKDNIRDLYSTTRKNSRKI